MIAPRDMKSRALEAALGARVRELRQQRDAMSPQRQILPAEPVPTRSSSRVVTEQIVISSAANIKKGDPMSISIDIDPPLTGVVEARVEELHIPRLTHNVSSELKNNTLRLQAHQQLDITEVRDKGAETRVMPRNAVDLAMWSNMVVAIQATASYFVSATYDIACAFPTPLESSTLTLLLASPSVVLTLTLADSTTVTDHLVQVAATSVCARLQLRPNETVSRVMETVLNEPHLHGALTLSFADHVVALQPNSPLSGQACVVKNEASSAAGLVSGVLQPISINGHSINAVSAANLVLVWCSVALDPGTKLRLTTSGPDILLVRHVAVVERSSYLVVAVPLYSASAQGKLQAGGVLYTETGTKVDVEDVKHDAVGVKCSAIVSVGEDLAIQTNTTCTCQATHRVSDLWAYNIYLHVSQGALRPSVEAARVVPSLSHNADGSTFQWLAHHTPASAAMHDKIGHDSLKPLARLHRVCSTQVVLADGAYTSTMATIQLRHHLRALMASLDTAGGGNIVDVTLSAVNNTLSTQLLSTESSCTTAIAMSSGQRPGRSHVTWHWQERHGGARRRNEAPHLCELPTSRILPAITGDGHGPGKPGAILPLHRQREERAYVIVTSGDGDRHVYRAPRQRLEAGNFPARANHGAWRARPTKDADV